MGSFLSNLRHGWNAFKNQDFEKKLDTFTAGVATYSQHRPDRRSSIRISNEQSIIASVYTRLAIDAAALVIKHVRLDDNGRYAKDMNSGLNNCLTLEANIDQAARHFRQDIYASLFQEGTLAIVPVDTDFNPELTGGYDILTMRLGRVVEWKPRHVRVNVYNVNTGLREDVLLEKRMVGIVENPFFSVMNEINSTLRRLTHKLGLLDAIDDQSSSGKLDIIIQLPYVVKSETRRQQAEQRRKDLEFQMTGSKYGIGYVDGTEKIVQLNRPAENQMLEQVKYLTEMLYNQLGLTESIMNGTADEATMLNYYHRAIEPVVDAVVEAMRRAFLTKTARSQKQSIVYFREPFKLVPLKEMAEIADKFSRNKIFSANEIRQGMGAKPSTDPSADKLENSNMPAEPAPNSQPTKETEGDSQNGSS